ncbi:MAG: Kelch repeat-containing protein [Solirubrobacterales bacterium]
MRSRASTQGTAKALLTVAVLAALALLAPVAEAGATPVLEPTGSLLTERYKAAAAPLPGGDALVVGGLHRVSPSSPVTESLASAEVYDGATGTFAATGSMATSRMDPTAAPLPDGRVLVAGGQVWGGGGTPLASAEIYDPASGEFSSTGSMAVARFGAISAPLPDGTILVAGGYGAGSLASAETYDPETGEFSPTGSMVAPRAMGLAATLPDGRVLIAAAGGGENELTTEIYDPLTGTFGIGPAETPAPLTGAGGSLDDGRVLFLSERRAGEATIERTYEYDTTAAAFAEPPQAPALAVSRPAVAPLPGGRMLVAGGASADPSAYAGQSIVPDAEVYAEGPAPTSSPESPAATGGEAPATGGETRLARSGPPAASGAAPGNAAAPLAGGSSATVGSHDETASPAAPRRARKICKRAGAGARRARRARCARAAAKGARAVVAERRMLAH